MRCSTRLLLGTALTLCAASPALAQDEAPQTPPGEDAAQQANAAQQEDAATENGEETIFVTARKRAETLIDVPVAISAVSGETIERRGLTSVRDIAQLTPGLNVSGDGTGRAFVAIRGVGVTLVQSVQPGVGIFLDGVYQPNTSYLNNPIVDVERVEVLRGPQGTLYGKNTLGGAINIITRQPGNDWHMRGNFSYAEPDESFLASASISGPIVTDHLQVRVAAAHRQQQGFIRNTLLGIDANPLNTDTLNATIRAVPTGDVVLTVNGYYDWIDGVNIPYAVQAGPRAYNRNVTLNTANRIHYRYRGVNARLEVPVDSIDTRISLIGAYDARSGVSPGTDADFGVTTFDIARLSGTDELRTRTVELRFDSEWSEQFSSLFGLFYSRETSSARQVVTILPPFAPPTLNNVAVSDTEADTYAAFGTLFWRPNEAWEVAAGLRYDHEKRDATGAAGAAIGPGNVNPPLTALPPASIESDQVEPRITVSRHWNNRFMSYASVARGYRGGGFNSPLAPFRTYQGDSAWTYELGSRFISLDRSISLSGAVFYNDYHNYIGLNSVAPAAGTLVTVDLNTGDVESYGAELEATVRPVTNWTLTGAFTWVHARITDSTPYALVTRRTLSSDRLTFQPDWNFSLYSDYVMPIGQDRLTFTAGLIGKGSRLAATLNQTTPTFLDEYFLVNAQIAYRHGPIEVALFANNLFNEDFYESYIERTTIALANLPAADVGIIGDRRRVGARLRLDF